MKIKNILYILIGCVIFSSCGDFLKEYSQDEKYASSTDDLYELLIGDGFESRYKATDYFVDFPFYLMDDDVDEFNVKYSSTYAAIKYKSFYTWQKDPFVASGKETDDEIWSDYYEHLGIVNVVIYEADRFSEGNTESYRRVLATSLFLRAFYYYKLNSLYGCAYNPQTAESDLGVPLKLASAVSKDYFSRNTTKENYDQMVIDLKKSIELFEGVSRISYMHPDKLAAQVLLSRIYLYMNKWNEVNSITSDIMQNPVNTLIDFNSTSMDVLYEDNSPEYIFSMGRSLESYIFKYSTSTRAGFYVSPIFYNSFDDKDLRKDFFFKKVTFRYAGLTGYVPIKSYSATNFNPGTYLRYAEVYLNRAEALAMQSNINDATSVMSDFLLTRYETGYAPTIPSSEDELVEFIRNERRKEFCFEAQRWNDLKRYAVLGNSHKYETEITHRYVDVSESTGTSSTSYYKLGKYSVDGGWLLPMPRYAIDFNNGELVDNERPNRDGTTDPE